MNSIENNLYEFYRIFETVKSVMHIQEKGFEVIQAPDNSWPQMIFNLDQATDTQKLIPTITAEIGKNQYPSSFIVPEGYLSRNHTELLKTNGLVPIKMLKGMNIVPEINKEITLPNNCEICDLIRETHLIAFANLIRKEFIAPEMSFRNGILSEVKSCKEIKMIGLFYEKTLVSSLLVLTKDNISGLYFIVTKTENKNQGYATTLINFVLNQLHNYGVKEVVLHANHNSFVLYKKLGFIEQNRFIIYRKLSHGQ